MTAGTATRPEGDAGGSEDLAAVPVADLRWVADATRRFLDVVEDLTGDDVGAASLLPGWTVGHILTHVARNADSHIRRSAAAMRGEVIDQYPGGFKGRAAEIEAGACRSAAAITDDVRSTAAALAKTWELVAGSAWLRPTRDVSGRERPLNELPARRWQELEVHVVDLGAGPTYRDWPDDFVAVWLPRLEAELPDRLATKERPEVSTLDERERLAWLYGRSAEPGLPELPPWV